MIKRVKRKIKYLYKKYKINKLLFFIENIYVKRASKCIVLLYHRIVDLNDDPQQLSVGIKKFEEQIIFLKKNFNIITLNQLYERLGKKKGFPKKSVVLTFDDGYYDNYLNAFTILKKHSIPATFFISTDYINSEKEFWWDELEKIFLNNKQKLLKKVLNFEINDVKYKWTINSIDDCNAVYQEIIPLIKYNSNSVREQKIDYLYKWSNAPKKGRTTHRVMTAMELKELSKNNLIEIGSHTKRHVCLAKENFETQQEEIAGSKLALEKLLNKKVNFISYPYGEKKDFNDNTLLITEKSGYLAGIANYPNVVLKKTEKFKIPREVVRNWDINIFSHYLNQFFRNKDLFDVLIDFFDKATKYIRINKKAKKIYNNFLLKQVKLNYTKSKRNKNNNQNKIKNILQVNIKDNIGGAAKVSSIIHNNLLKLKINSKLLLAHSELNENNTDVIKEDDSKEHKLLINWQKMHDWIDFFYLDSFKIKDYDVFKNSDLVHYHALHGYYFSPFALPELTALKPSVWTLHDMQAFTGHCCHSLDCNKWETGCGKCPYLNIYPKIKNDTSAFLWKIKKEIYDKSYFTIVCPSTWLLKKTEKSMMKDKRIELISNGVDIKLFSPGNKKVLRKKLNISADKIILLFIANDGLRNDWKGGDFVQKLYNELSNNDRIFFLNIGKSNSNTFVKKNWIEIPYIFKTEELAEYMKLSDILVYPSIADNCPLVVIEGMSTGMPVVTFNTGGIPELVTHNKTGYVADYKNFDDFLKGIKLLIGNDKLRRKYSIESRKDSVNRFSIELMVKKYLKIYSETYDNFYKNSKGAKNK